MSSPIGKTAHYILVNTYEQAQAIMGGVQEQLHASTLHCVDTKKLTDEAVEKITTALEAINSKIAVAAEKLQTKMTTVTELLEKIEKAQQNSTYNSVVQTIGRVWTTVTPYIGHGVFLGGALLLRQYVYIKH